MENNKRGSEKEKFHLTFAKTIKENCIQDYCSKGQDYHCKRKERLNSIPLKQKRILHSGAN